MTDADVAWAAGLFEGEGCIYWLERDGKVTNRTVVVTSTDRDVLERFQRIVGCGRIMTGSNARLNPAWKPNHEWRVTSYPEGAQVLNLFLPWLGERRRAKAEAFLARGLEGRYGTARVPKRELHTR